MEDYIIFSIIMGAFSLVSMTVTATVAIYKKFYAPEQPTLGEVQSLLQQAEDRLKADAEQREENLKLRQETKMSLRQKLQVVQDANRDAHNTIKTPRNSVQWVTLYVLAITPIWVWF